MGVRRQDVLRAVRYAGGIAALRRSDVLLASFPRSGNTLLRTVLAHVLDPQAMREDSSFERLNRSMPELGVSALWMRRGRHHADHEVRLIKTHRPWSRWISRPRAVWLVRSPLDALASYHRYWTSRVDGPTVSASSFLRDPRRGLPWWIRHTTSWRQRAGVQLTYSDLRERTANAAARVLTLAGIEVSKERLETVAARATPQAMPSKPVGGSDSFVDGFVFAADRPSGSGVAYFSEQDLDWATARLRQEGLEEWIP